MITGQMISTILQGPSLTGTTLALYPGQIVRGELVKHISDQQALVQIGGLRLVADLQAKLPVGETVWLQVQKTGPSPVLKVLQAADQNLNHTLGLEDSPENTIIIKNLIEENLPIDPQQVGHLKELLANKEISIDTLIFAMNKGIPLTTDALTGLEQFFINFTNSNIAGLNKEQLVKELLRGQESSGEALLILEEIDTVLSSSTGEQIKKYLSLLDRLNMELMSMKEKGILTKSSAVDSAIRFIHGQQLLLIPTETPLQQWLIHLPFNELGNSLMQIESRKQPHGQIDSENCRLLFFLDMLNLGSLIIDVSIVNKIVSLQVRGNHSELSQLAQGFRDELTKCLQNLGYNLSALRTSALQAAEKEKNPHEMIQPYRGVDLRI